MASRNVSYVIKLPTDVKLIEALYNYQLTSYVAEVGNQRNIKKPITPLEKYHSWVFNLHLSRKLYHSAYSILHNQEKIMSFWIQKAI